MSLTNAGTATAFVINDTNGATNTSLDIQSGGVSKLTIDELGNVTTAGDVAVNGGDITTTNATATLFNTGATNLSIGGAATTLSFGATTGTTTVNNALNVTGLATLNGGATVPTGQTFLASGSSVLAPNGTNSLTVNTDADSFLILNGLTTPGTAGSALCLDGSNNVTKCASSTFSLQGAYNGGNSIVTSDNRDIVFNLTNTATDSNFNIITSAGSIGFTHLFLADGDNSTPAAQLALFENLDSNDLLPAAIKIQSSAGGITNALDLSDPEIVNALSLGANDITATNFSITGASGNITTTGDITVNGVPGAARGRHNVHCREHSWIFQPKSLYVKAIRCAKPHHRL